MKIILYETTNLRDKESVGAIVQLLLNNGSFHIDVGESFLTEKDLKTIKEKWCDEEILQLLLGIMLHTSIGALNFTEFCTLLSYIKNPTHLNDEEFCNLLKTYYIHDGKFAEFSKFSIDKKMIEFCLQKTKMSDMVKDIIRIYHQTHILDFDFNVTKKYLLSFIEWFDTPYLKFTILRAVLTPPCIDAINKSGAIISTQSKCFYEQWINYTEDITVYGRNVCRLLQYAAKYCDDNELRDVLMELRSDKLDNSSKATYVRLMNKIVL